MYAPVKIVSIVDPSILVIVQVKAPQVAARPLTLVASASVQLKILAVLLTIYVKAGKANLLASIVKESVRHGLLTAMLKVCVIEI